MRHNNKKAHPTPPSQVFRAQYQGPQNPSGIILKNCAQWHKVTPNDKDPLSKWCPTKPSSAQPWRKISYRFENVCSVVAQSNCRRITIERVLIGQFHNLVLFKQLSKTLPNQYQLGNYLIIISSFNHTFKTTIEHQEKIM